MPHKYQTRSNLFPTSPEGHGEFFLHGELFNYDEEGTVFDDNFEELGRISDDNNKPIWCRQNVMYVMRDRIKYGLPHQALDDILEGLLEESLKEENAELKKENKKLKMSIARHRIAAELGEGCLWVGMF
jgi:hypothetical protein